MPTRPAKGFTLVELMIVVAIIGLLAAIAIPSYQEHVARAQVSEGLQLMSGAKAPLAEYYGDQGRWPANPSELGLNIEGKYVLSAWDFESGGGSTALTLAMVATFRSSDISASIRGKKLVLETENGGKLWRCRRHTGADGIETRFLPNACR